MQNTARLLAALLSLIAGPALAQCPANFPANSVGGRLAIPAAGGPCQAIPFQQFANSLFSASTVTLPTLRVIATNPTLSTVDYGFATSNKAVAFSTTVTGTGSGVGSGGIAQLRVTPSATDFNGAPAWSMQTRVEADVESYAGIAIWDLQSAAPTGSAFAAILRNGIAAPGDPLALSSAGNYNGMIAFSEANFQGSNAFLAINSTTLVNTWQYGFRAVNADKVMGGLLFAKPGIIEMRRLNNNNSAPTALASGDHILEINGFGWGTAWSAAPRAAIEFRASQTWTAANQGASVFVRATMPNTTSTNDVAKFDGDIPLSVLQVGGDNPGQSLRLVPLYDNTKYWDIWTGTSGGFNITNSAGVGLGIDTSATIFSAGANFLAVVAPSTPAAGRAAVYVDSTTLALVNKDASGIIHTTVTPDTGASNNFLTAIGANGAISKAQPSFSNLSGSLACSQHPALTGDVTTSAGACATAIGATKVTSAMLNSDVFSTAHSWGGIQTLTTPIFTGLPTGTGVATANTVSTLVARDGSGNFSAGTITAALTGNASTATNATNATNTAITDDTTTNATMFPTWVTANTGNLPQKVTSTKLSFNPSTGLLNGVAVQLNMSTAAFTEMLILKSATDAAPSVTAISMRDTSNNPYMLQWSDPAPGSHSFRFKSLGTVSFHAGNVAVSAANQWLSLATTGAIALGDGTGVAHLSSSGAAAPALTSCGTSPSISGSDLAGTVTMGTAAPTGCVITFNTAYAAAPHCVVTWRATPLLSQSYTVSTTALTLTQTATSSDLVDYICIGA